jgi:hypothetical protein
MINPERMATLIKLNGGPSSVGRTVDGQVGVDLLSAGVVVNINGAAVRWQGQTEDIQQWTVVLGAFVPVSGQNPGAAPDGLPTGINFSPLTDVPVLATVKWGSGGVQHVAEVDWPCRGGTFTITGSYVEVIATANYSTLAKERVPRLSATVGPATGGQGKTIPATRTYTPLLYAPLGLRDLQIPTFARRVTPMISAGVTATFRITFFDTFSGSNLGQFDWLNNANRSSCERGQMIPIPARAYLARLTNTDAAVSFTGTLMFELDL